MASVTNIVIKPQTGSDSTYFATWDFGETTTTTSSGIKKGNLVSIKSGATYYNGVSIPSWVMNDKWYITQVKGDRAVLGQNQAKTNNIQSPINTKYLTGGSSSSVSSNTLDHYEVKWYYDTGDNVWFSGSTSDEKSKQATYSAPANAIRIKVAVKPVSKTRKVNNKDTSYWTGKAVTKIYSLSADPPEEPSTPTVEVEKFTLTASLENIDDPRTDKIQFQVVNGTKVFKTGTATVVTCQASFSCAVTAGGEYRVRCRAININGSTEVYSDWSDYTSSTSTVPSAPSSITICRASSETSVYLEWAEVSTAESYEIEYTTKKTYFDGSDQTTTISSIEFAHYEKTGLESGQEYFFRVRAVNEHGESAWSGIKSVVIGKAPSAPTTWSSTTKVITGEKLTLYWVHNSEDSSSQTYAELELYIGADRYEYTIQNSTDEEEKDKTSSYVIDTSSYTEGMSIRWRVRTAGVTKAYGDWSVQRTVDVFAPPTQTLEVTYLDGTPIETLTGFPFYVSVIPGPNTQAPIGYHLTITANESYETVDNLGNVKMVSAGDSVYSKYFDIKTSLLVEFSAGNIDLEDGMSYTITSTVSMDSGLTNTGTIGFDVAWTDVSYEPDVEVAIDNDILVAYIRPYCRDEDGALVEDVTLSVYRREFDGSFTEIATDLSNVINTIVTDPHPALDYARYRVVAKTISTGAISYYDAPGYPVGHSATVIQWAEEWTNFETSNEDEMENPPWSGSFLRLPYNIKVSDKSNPDVSLVNYIGRSHPVGYYGTQIGHASTWNVDIDKNDVETLYALRRLSRWMGDVYVREPSGSGYWANIKVSYSISYDNLVIPVTFDVTRVEGGA